MSSALLLRFIFSRIWARDRYNLKTPSPSSASPAQLNVSMAGDHVLQPLAHNRVIVGDDRPNHGVPAGTGVETGTLSRTAVPVSPSGPMSRLPPTLLARLPHAE